MRPQNALEKKNEGSKEAGTGPAQEQEHIFKSDTE